jgi:bla regulator protein BlaR1
MPALFVFLLKVNIALLLFCAGYYLVLRHLTFYTLNRIYLVAAILFATVYPKINLDSFAQRHQQLARPVQVVMLNLAPAETLVKPLAQPAYWHWAELLFFVGAAFLAIRLLMQLFSLYKLHRGSIPMKVRGHDVRIVHGNDAPFSFWKSIYINPAKHGEADLKAILKHEQVHVDEWHTLDILLAEISTIFYWFNPGIWLMKRAVRENIEFITDRKILKNGIDSKQYQYSLINVSFAAAPHNLVNHFNLSTIKKRIVMMNAKRSSRAKLTRYAFLIPAVLICLLTFSFSKAELVKKSKSTYKALTLSVATIAHIASEKLDAKYVTTLFEQKDTIKALNLKIDTNKKYVVLRGYSNFSFVNADTIRVGKHATVDSVRVVKVFGGGVGLGNVRIGDSVITKARLNGRDIRFVYTVIDTNKMKGLNVNRHPINTDSVIYIVDGKIGSFSLNNLNPADILSIDVLKNNRIISVTTNHNNNPVVVNTADNKEVLLDKMRGFNVSKNGIVTHDTVLIEKTASASQRSNQPVVVRGYRIGTAPGGSVTKTNSEISIDNLSAKLIYIDGKEASEKEFKKLSAADIKSVSVKSGDDIVKQYGSKAKDGVLFITTKKAK